MIYALITKEKADRKKKQKDSLFVDSLTAVIDEYIYHDSVNFEILEKLKPQDTLVIENIQSLGKSVSEIVETLNMIAQYHINLCLIRENLSFKADTLPEIASSLLIAFRLHQSLISLRSQNSLQERKAKGAKLGRPFGFNPDLKLDDHKDEIKEMLLAGVSKDKIAEQYNVCRSTVYNFVKKNPELLSGEAL